MSKHGPRFYDFGPFRLDAENHTLARAGEPVTLTRKAVEMLTLLVERRGEVISKEELLSTLWPDTTVEGSNLTQNVYMIRQALGEGAQQQTYIETIPKRGYRFAAEVTEVGRNGHAPHNPHAAVPHATSPHTTAGPHAPPGRRTADAPADPYATNSPATDSHTTGSPPPAPDTGELTLQPAAAADPAPAPPHEAAPDAAPDHTHAAPPLADVHAGRAHAVSGEGARRRPVGSAVLVALIAAALALAAAFVYFRAKGGARTDGPRSIAVLPLRPLGADAESAHLGLGMTDAIVTKLSNLQNVSVRPTSAIFKYTNKEYDPVRAGRELGVGAVLEGSVQRAGENVRVSVRLLSIPDGRPLWGESFSRKMTDVFAVQDAISEEVADALRLKLTTAERTQLSKHYTQNTEAYQAYVRGLYFWNQRTEEGFRQSIKHFDEAIGRDPSYALAYAGLADTYGLVAYYRYERVVPRAEALPRARRMAERAVELDDTVAEAHAALGLVKSLESDMQGAIDEYKRAVALNPNYATARQRFALTLLTAGRLGEATAEMQRAQGIDPLSVVIGINLAQMYYFGRDYERAATLCERTIETAPPGINQLLLTQLLANTRIQQGRLEEARKLFEGALEQNDDFDEAREGLAYTAALAGRRDDALAYSPRFRELTKEYPQAHLSLALVHSALGEPDAALAELDSYAKGQPYPSPTLRFDPRLDPLRPDPRFAEIFRRNFREQ